MIMRKFTKLLKRNLQNQKGSVLILFAGAMIMLFGFTAIAVDGGSLYLEKSRLQKILDAAVLGGAKGLLDSESLAKKIALKIGTENGLNITGSDNITEPNYIKTGTNYIEIQQTVNKDLTFARILGFPNADVVAVARAELKGAMVEASGAIPLALPKSEYKAGESYELVLKPGNGHSGNYHYIAPKRNDSEDEDETGNSGGSGNGNGNGNGNGGGNGNSNGNDKDQGAKALKEGIMYGTPIGQIEFTEPGRNEGPAKEGFEYRINKDIGKEHCKSWETADQSCKRFVIIPLVETFEESNGRKEINIIGFAAFWIEGFSEDGKTVLGKFVKGLGEGKFEPGKPNYGVYDIKLVK